MGCSGARPLVGDWQYFDVETFDGVSHRERSFSLPSRPLGHTPQLARSTQAVPIQGVVEREERLLNETAVSAIYLIPIVSSLEWGCYGRRKNQPLRDSRQARRGWHEPAVSAQGVSATQALKRSAGVSTGPSGEVVKASCRNHAQSTHLPRSPPTFLAYAVCVSRLHRMVFTSI